MNKLILFSFVLLCCVLIACKADQKSEEHEKIESNEEEGSAAELYQNFQADPVSQFEKESNELIEYAMNNGIAAVSTPSGLLYEIEDLGSGNFLQHGDEVSAHYKGMFLDGTVFDSSYKRGKPLTFKVGQMINGWNEGLSFMKRGDKAILLIPSKLGYGEKGFPGFVPPNTPLVFELELLR